MTSQDERAAMARALAVAAVPGWRDVNPRVGAVVLDPDGRELAVGHHRGSGTPHAEGVALQLAGDAARGSTVVVTMEPCHQNGRTPACTGLLLDASVARVVYAVDDPNPCASGGAAVLRAAGVDVESGLLAAEATKLNEFWLFAMRHARPFVTWKLATTLDGRSAAADGSSRWITGPEARADVQTLRAQADTILVGSGTVRADDPWLVLRDAADRPLPRRRQPRRAVMGRTPIPSDARVLDAAAETVLLDTRDPVEAISRLAALGARHVWLEGGPVLASAFIRAGLVDRCVAYVAPALLGAGPSAVAGLGVGGIEDIIRLPLVDVRQVGADVRLTLGGVPPREQS